MTAGEASVDQSTIEKVAHLNLFHQTMANIKGTLNRDFAVAAALWVLILITLAVGMIFIVQWSSPPEKSKVKEETNEEEENEEDEASEDEGKSSRRSMSRASSVVSRESRERSETPGHLGIRRSERLIKKSRSRTPFIAPAEN
eukprot:comp22133_c0_seq1/m.32378 comp22133_c0_seq1/g.32378  ORF comp22133_c0_seq1/g.32378 comp22133_c0_seq1/m.32378 type:complete len:143 (-) comp22133_c0_seq1:446-874(-)